MDLQDDRYFKLELQVKELSKRNDRLSEENYELMNAEADTLQKLEEANSQNHELYQQVQALQETQRLFDDEIKGKNIEIENLTKENQSMKNKLQMSQMLTNDYEKIQMENQRLSSETFILQQEINKLVNYNKAKNDELKQFVETTNILALQQADTERKNDEQIQEFTQMIGDIRRKLADAESALYDKDQTIEMLEQQKSQEILTKVDTILQHQNEIERQQNNFESSLVDEESVEEEEEPVMIVKMKEFEKSMKEKFNETVDKMKNKMDEIKDEFASKDQDAKIDETAHARMIMG